MPIRIFDDPDLMEEDDTLPPVMPYFTELAQPAGSIFDLLTGAINKIENYPESTEAPLAETSLLPTAVSAPILEALIPGKPGVDYFPEDHKPSRKTLQKLNEAL